MKREDWHDERQEFAVINEVVAYVRGELRDRLPVANSEVMIESARVLSRQGNDPGVYITVVRVEPDQHMPNSELPLPGGQEQPPISLRLYLLFSFEFQTYETSLLHLSNTIGLFHEKPAYDAATASSTNPFPVGLETLKFGLHPMDFEALNNLWGVMGAAHVPSVVYQVSGVQIPRSQ